MVKSNLAIREVFDPMIFDIGQYIALLCVDYIVYRGMCCPVWEVIGQWDLRMALKLDKIAR